MVKKIIYLIGEKDSGKTITLNYLASLFPPKDISHQTPLIKDDCNYTIEYKGQVVVITTSGDAKKIIEENYEYCEKNKGNIWITAKRSKVHATEIFSKFTTEDPIRKNKDVAKDPASVQSVNKNQAQKLKDLIEKIIDTFHK